MTGPEQPKDPRSDAERGDRPSETAHADKRDVRDVGSRLYRQLFDEDVTGRIVARADWTVVDCNSSGARMLGWESPSNLAGQRLSDYVANPVVLQKLLAVARAQGSAGPIDVQLERPGRNVVQASLFLVVDLDDARRDVSVIRAQLVDVTESRQDQLRQTGGQRMEAIGRLAGGLAHDFNNLLTVIGGHSERLCEALGPEHPLRASAIAIQQAAGRAALLTRQLLAFSRRQVFELKPIAVHRLLAEAEPLLKGIVGEAVALRLDLPSELPDIRADARQLELVVVNLALNARDAMTTGGTLTICVDSTVIGEPPPKDRSWLRPGRYVRIVVADTGPGMDPLTRTHAFEPFFTTKQLGQGTGLGLATVYGIVKQSNGFVWVDSEVGKGAAFTLLFPVFEPRAEPVSAGRRDGGTETILVVEPDGRVRTFVADALRRRGYQVLDTASGESALELFVAYPARVHLLLCDAAVAASSAIEAKLKAIDPLLQALFMVESLPAGAPPIPPGTPSIAKPFTLQALAADVRSVLDSGLGRG